MKKLYFALSVLAIFLIALLAEAPLVKAQYSGPSATPPGNNPSGPVWLQTGAAQYQHGDIYLGTASGDDLFIRSSNAIRADQASGIGTLNMSNYASGATGFTLNLRGNIVLDSTLSGTPGNLYVPQICLGPSGSQVCRTTWPTGVTGSGTTNYVPLFTSGTALGNSIITQTNSRVAVGASADNVTGVLNVDGGMPIGVSATGTAFGVYGEGNRVGVRGYSANGQFGVEGVSNSSQLGGGTGVRGIGYVGMSGTGYRYGVNGEDVSDPGSGAWGMRAYSMNNNGLLVVAGGDEGIQTAAGQYGINSSGGTAGGWFKDGGGTSEAFVAYGNNGIDATGDTAGGWFRNGNGTSEARVAYSTYGINATGIGYGGRFTGTTSTAYGVIGQGGNMGGYFYDSDASGVARVGYADYGVYGWGDTAGGYFYDLNGSAGAYIAYGSYGIHATNDTYGGYFGNTVNTLNRAYLASQTTGVIGYGSSYGGRFYDDDNTAEAWTAAGNDGFYGYGSGYGIRAEGGTAGAQFQPLAASGVAVDALGSVNISTKAGGADASGRGSQLSITNPNNSSASIALRWMNDIPSFRYGGTGAGASSGFQIQSSGDTVRFALDGSGNLMISGTNAQKAAGTTWIAASDIRLKDVVGPYTRGLEDISRLSPIIYEWKDSVAEKRGVSADQQFIGFSAQAVQKVIPEAVKTGSDGYLLLDADPILWASVNAIKELEAENDELRARIEALEAKLK